MSRPEWSFFMLPEDHKEVKWAQSFLQAKLSVWGQIIFGMLLVGLAISSVGTQISAYYFVSFVLALFLTALFLTTFFKPKVVAVRILPATPTAGGMCLCRVRLTNLSSKPLRNIEIFEHKLPYGIYRIPDHPQQNTTIDWLKPGQQIVFTIALRIVRRGSYILEPWIAATSFPTGLIRSMVPVAGREAWIVYPKLLIINNFEMGLKQQFQPGGSNASLKFGNSNEFLSTRDYRPGDRPRDIHWNSSARAGKLIVKEYTNEYDIRVGLFLDTELRRFEKHLCFEALISLCGGLAEDFYKKNYKVNVYLSEYHSSVVEIGGGRDQLNHLLEILSAVEGQERACFEHSLALIQQKAGGMSGWVILLKDWDQSRADFVQTLREFHVPLQVIIIRDKPVSYPFDQSWVTVYTPQQLGYQI